MAVLAVLGGSPPELALFQTLDYGIQLSLSDLPQEASHDRYNVEGLPTTEEDCRAALSLCLRKGWLQVVDEPALARITQELQEARILGPIYYLPEVGCVDFTWEGAQVWQSVCRELWGERTQSSFSPEPIHSKVALYFRTEQAAAKHNPQLDSWGAVTSKSAPVAIGPWRIQWWRRCSTGYRVDIEERGGRRCEHWRPSWCEVQRVVNPKRLQHILDCHNVTVGEWLILSGIDAPPGWQNHFPLRAAAEAAQTAGFLISDEDCKAGLEGCLRNGWARVVDNAAWQEIQQLLDEDPCLTPLYWAALPGYRTVDFTRGGAVLYQMIQAEYLGISWDAEMLVEKEHYRKQHLYCTTEDIARAALRTHAAHGDTLLSSSIVPIGPWCVYWWRRFSAGYLLEVELADPLS